MSDTQPAERASSAAPAIPGYQIIEKYAETSRAEVWCALQISLERTVTLWVLKHESAADHGVADHFERVARAVSRIRHPNFVQVIDISRLQDGTPYMVLENVEGASLTATLHVDRRFDQKRAAAIVLEIAKGLDFAWKQCGFIHRNIKPDTILLSAGDAVKITNYNTAALVRPGENPLAYDGGMVVGTPNYASPEQIECLRTIDFHSDMYSTGALFYQMVTGLMPFGGESDQMKVLDLQRSGTLEDPRSIVPTVLPGIVHIMQRMMAKSPEERYAWWQDVVEDLQRVLAGRPPYIPSGSYVAPLSTIAVSGAGAAASEVSPGAAKPKRRIRQTASVSQTPSSARPAAGPGCLGRLLGLAFVVAVCAFVAHQRIQSLERPVAASGDQATLSSESVSAAPDVETVDAAEQPADAAESAADATDESSTSAEPALDPAAGEGDAASIAASAAASTATAPSATDAVPGVDVQEQLLKDIHEALKTRPFSEAVAFAKKTFKENEASPGVDLAECRRIWDALRTACSFEDMLGHAVASSHGSRKMSVAGEEFVFTTTAYADGELIGLAAPMDGTAAKPVRIKVARMAPQEMYDLVLSTAASTNRADLFSRAFLIMKVGDAGGFSLFVEKHKLDELAPFIDYVGK